MQSTLTAVRRACAPALLPLLIALSAAPAAAQDVYTNPVLARPQGVADPFILKFNGEYYLYATGDPILIYHSTDLVSWDEVGPAVASSKAPGDWNQADVWAPEVVYRNGLFYLYYSATQASPSNVTCCTTRWASTKRVSQLERTVRAGKVNVRVEGAKVWGQTGPEICI